MMHITFWRCTPLGRWSGFDPLRGLRYLSVEHVMSLPTKGLK